MKPNFSKKSGYSLKDTFIMIIKCLVLTFAFFFIGVQASEDKVEGASVGYFVVNYSSSQNLGSRTTATGGNPSITYSKYAMSNEAASYYAVTLKIDTTNSAASVRSFQINIKPSLYVSTTESYDFQKTAVELVSTVNVIYMNRTSPLRCAYSVSVCSSAPSGFSTAGATLLLPYSYMSYYISVEGGGKYWGTDYESGDSTQNGKTFTITDSIGPSVTNLSISNSYAGTWTNKNVTITVSGAVEHYSYVSQYKACKGKTDSTSNCQTSTTGSFTYSAAMNSTLYFKAKDRDGHWSSWASASTTVKIDRTAPTITGKLTVVDNDEEDDYATPSAGYTNSTAVKTSGTISAADSGTYKSGIDYIILWYYDTDTDEWDAVYTSYSEDGAVTAPPSGTAFTLSNYEGNHIFEYDVCDIAGNCTSISYEIVLDTTSPTVDEFQFVDGDLSDNYVTPMEGYTNSTTLKYSKAAGSDNSGGSGIWKYKVSATGIEVIMIPGSATTSKIIDEVLYALSTSNVILSSQSNATVSTLPDKFFYGTTQGSTVISRKICYYIYDYAGNGDSLCIEFTNSNYDAEAPEFTDFGLIDGDMSNNYNDNTVPGIVGISGITNSGVLAFTHMEASDNNLWYYDVNVSVFGASCYGYYTYTSIELYDATTPTLMDLESDFGCDPDEITGFNVNIFVIDKAGNAAPGLEVFMAYDATPVDVAFDLVSTNSDSEMGYTNVLELEIYITGENPGYADINYYVIYELDVSTSTALFDGAEAILEIYGTETLTLEDDTEGERKLTLYVYDLAGNRAEALYTIIYDVTAPTATGNFSITDGDMSNNYYEPESGWTNSTVVEYVSVPTFSDASGIKYYNINEYVYVNDVKEEKNSTGPSISVGGTFEILDYEGPHTFTYTAYDRAGNQGYKTASITYVKTAPTITGTFAVEDGDTSNNTGANIAANSGYTNSSRLKVTSVPTITYPTVASVGENNYMYAINDHVTEPTIVSPTTRIGKLATEAPINIVSIEGLHTLTYIVYDYAGNYASIEITIILDITAAEVIDLTVVDGDMSDNTYQLPYISDLVVGFTGYTNSLSFEVYAEVEEDNISEHDLEIYTTHSDGTVCYARYTYETYYNYIDELIDMLEEAVIFGCEESDFDTLESISIVYYAIDQAGNKSEEEVIDIIYDGEAPEVVISIKSTNDESENGYTNVLELELEAEIGEEGMASFYYFDLCEGEELLYSGEELHTIIELLSSNEGERILTLYLYDVAGNMREVEASIIYDETNPEIEATCEAGGVAISCGTWTNKNVTVKLNGTDTGGSGVKGYSVSTTGSSYTTPGATKEWTHTVTQNSIYYYRVKDKAGNISDVISVAVRIDKEAPTGNIECKVEGTTIVCGTWTNKSVEVEVDGTDTGGSGIKGYAVSETSGSGYGSIVATNTWTYSLHGQKTYYYKVYDNAGNESEEYSALVKIDLIKPVINTFSVEDNNSDNGLGLSGYTNNVGLKCKETHTESDSGIGDYYIYDNGVNVWGTSGTLNGKEYNLRNIEGEHVISVVVYDVAGNASATKTYRIILDTVEQEVKLNGETDVISGVNPGESMSLTIADANAVSATYNGKKAYYYMSVEDVFKFTQDTKHEIAIISDMLTVVDLKGVYTGEYDASGNPVNITEYYVYIFVGIEEARSWEKAGNAIEMDENDFMYPGTNPTHIVKRFTIIPNIIEDADTGEFDAERIASLKETPERFESNDIKGNISIQELEGNNVLLFILEQTVEGIGVVPFEVPTYQALSMELIEPINTTETRLYTNPIVKLGDNYKVFGYIIILNEAPKVTLVGTENMPVKQVVNKGEEISNIGLSFTTGSDGEIEVDTLITLNGVKVKKIDTNKVGVYNIVQVATDRAGRSHTVRRQVIVEEGKVENIVVEKEEIKEEIKVEVVVNKVVEKTSNEVVKETRVEVETNRVEMRLEKAPKVKGYKKRKEIKRVRKESFTFKLFSKYFFKIYDG